MSNPFQKIMRDLNALLKVTYNAHKVAIIPGSGTFGMEAVARQFAKDEHVMVIRNGWFSFRWTEIFDMGGENSIPKSHTVLKAQPVPTKDSNSPHTHYAPYPIDEVIAKIKEERPAVLFAPHVETSTGMILPDDYIRKATAAMHKIGGLFVLDCIASGAIWADMKDLGVDVVVSAPQKGWTGPACAALVMMSEAAAEKMQTTQESSFSLSLKRWSAIMDTYENGGFGYHTTMPTDALRDFHEISVETLEFGLPELKEAQLKLGKEARAALESRGLTSVAAPGFQAPGVLVYYSPLGTENPVMMNRFKEQGLQIAMGVPWRIDEPDGLKTFRLGLFGLDKMGNIPDTVDVLCKALDRVLVESGHVAPERKVA
jgi:aspartate aminotransferase-like enzyme